MSSRKRESALGSFTAIGSALFIASLILAAALLFGFLTGCSMRSATVLDPRLTAPCERPALLGPTNRDIWVLAIEQAYALGECDGRMGALRELSGETK